MRVTPRAITLCLAAAVTSAPLVLSTPATADARRVDDRKSDVWESRYSDDGVLLGRSKAGSRLNTDILKTTVVHGTRRIKLVTRYNDLRPKSLWFTTGYDLQVEGFDETLYVRVSTDRLWSGDLSAYSAVDGEVVVEECDRMRHRIDYDRNTVLFGIARACLDGPDWIQVSSLTSAEHMRTNRFFRDVYDSAKHAASPPGPQVKAG